MSCEAARRDFDATIFDLDGVLIECDGDPQIFKSGKSSDPPALQLAHDRFWHFCMDRPRVASRK